MSSIKIDIIFNKSAIKDRFSSFEKDLFLGTHCVTIVSVKQRKEVIPRLIVLSKKLFPAKCKSAYSFLSTVRPQDSQS